MIVFSLLLVFFRNTYLEFWGVTLAVFLLSISSLFYIIVGQFFFSKLLKLVPISGFAGGWDLFVFLALPIVIGIAVAAGRRGAVLPHDVPRGDRQGLRAHRALEGALRDRRAVPPRAAQRAAADPHQHRRRAAAPVPGRAHHGIVLRDPGPRQLHDRRHQRAGLRRRALDGVRGLGALHRRPHPDRHLVHGRRSAHPA